MTVVPLACEAAALIIIIFMSWAMSPSTRGGNEHA